MNPQNFEPAILLRNNTPLDDFCGLTPNEVHHLLYNPHGQDSPLHFCPDLEHSTLDRIPFFRLTEEFLRIVRRDKAITLTGLGALPRKYLHELYAHRFIPERHIDRNIIRLNRENDSVPLTSMHICTEQSGLMKKTKGKLRLTKEGERMLAEENRRELFQRVLMTFTLSFAWSNNDAWTERPLAQFGWGFSVYLLFRFGNQPRPVQFYADKYLQAFPTLIEWIPPNEYSTPQNDFFHCYCVRTFSRFLEWFGCVTITPSEGVTPTQAANVARTELLEKVLSLEARIPS